MGKGGNNSCERHSLAMTREELEKIKDPMARLQTEVYQAQIHKVLKAKAAITGIESGLIGIEDLPPSYATELRELAELTRNVQPEAELVACRFEVVAEALEKLSN